MCLGSSLVEAANFQSFEAWKGNQEEAPRVRKCSSSRTIRSWPTESLVTFSDKFQERSEVTLLPPVGCGAFFQFFWGKGSDFFKLSQQKKGALFSHGIPLGIWGELLRNFLVRSE